MLSIIIPVYNEEAILQESLAIVHERLLGREHEVLVVSNGSTDQTNEIGQRLASEHDWLRFFAIECRGPGLAFVRGVGEARGDVIITLDIDLSSDLTFIDIASHLLNYAEIVVGSKTMGNQRRGFVRILGSQLYITLTQILFNLTLSDYSIGSKAFRREAIVPALPYLDHWTGYVFELCLLLRLQGKKVIQVGIDCDDRRKSHFNLLYEGFYRFKHLFEYRRKLKNPDFWLHRVS